MVITFKINGDEIIQHVDDKKYYYEDVSRIVFSTGVIDSLAMSIIADCTVHVDQKDYVIEFFMPIRCGVRLTQFSNSFDEICALVCM